MNDRNHLAWTRLVAAARRSSANPDLVSDLVAPVGFTTRVVERAGLRADAGAAGLFGAGFDRLAARALGLAGACAFAFAVWGAVPATAEARSSEAATTADAYLDPVGDYLVAVQSS